MEELNTNEFIVLPKNKNETCINNQSALTKIKKIRKRKRKQIEVNHPLCVFISIKHLINIYIFIQSKTTHFYWYMSAYKCNGTFLQTYIQLVYNDDNHKNYN